MEAVKKTDCEITFEIDDLVAAVMEQSLHIVSADWEGMEPDKLQKLSEEARLELL